LVDDSEKKPPWMIIFMDCSIIGITKYFEKSNCLKRSVSVAKRVQKRSASFRRIATT
jgi:hypothetical protein